MTGARYFAILEEDALSGGHPKHHHNTLYCGYCGACQHDVALLILGGPHNAICDKCVDDCARVVADHRLGIHDQLDEIRLLGT